MRAWGSSAEEKGSQPTLYACWRRPDLRNRILSLKSNIVTAFPLAWLLSLFLVQKHIMQEEKIHGIILN